MKAISTILLALASCAMLHKPASIADRARETSQGWIDFRSAHTGSIEVVGIGDAAPQPTTRP